MDEIIYAEMTWSEIYFFTKDKVYIGPTRSNISIWETIVENKDFFITMTSDTTTTKAYRYGFCLKSISKDFILNGTEINGILYDEVYGEYGQNYDIPLFIEIREHDTNIRMIDKNHDIITRDYTNDNIKFITKERAI